MDTGLHGEKVLLNVILTKCVPHQSIRIEARKGERLSEALWLSGRLAVSALCSGLGHCGACRVRFLKDAPEATEEESADLGAEAVADGWRLSCRHCVRSEAWLSVPAEPAECSGGGVPGAAAGDGAEALLAVDLGTTSTQWRALCPDGRTLAEGGMLNPQLAAGSDVMSRIAMACTGEGAGRLRAPVVGALRRIAAGVPGGVRELCVAGNPAMTAILAGKACSGLSAAPYQLAEEGGRAMRIEGLPPLWLPDQIAPFVGGDISSGMLWLLEQQPQFPFLLADMGTNGEFVLAFDESHALAASVPLGPALEGIGLSCGTNAGPGSIVGFDMAPDGLKCRFWENAGSRAEGIAGTGYLSLIALLLREGVLLASGQPAKDALSPLARRLLALLRRDGQGAWRFELPHGMCLTAHDVEAVLKVRAAFAMAAGQLTRAAGLHPENVCWYLAGALGWHAPRAALEQLGFIPAGLGARVRSIGNASLNGACLLLCRPELRERMRQWKRGCAVLDLTSLPDAESLYVQEMRFQAMRQC